LANYENNENRLKIRGSSTPILFWPDCLRPFSIYVPLRNAASMSIFIAAIGTPTQWCESPRIVMKNVTGS